jgi:hypothetical protein
MPKITTIYRAATGTAAGLLIFALSGCATTSLPPPPEAQVESILPPPPPPPHGQVIEGLVDGASIRTSNSYGNIEVRAMSYGPAVCTTHITVGDRTVSIAAPPAAYSPWVMANSHTASLSFNIGKRDQCDTRTEAQIRYWKG